MIKDFQIMGTIGKIDTIQLKTGGAGCEVRVACSSMYKGEETTEWFGVTLFGKSAETVLEVYNVGDMVYFTGIIGQDKWMDKDSGKERSKVKFTGFRCRRIRKGKLSTEQGGGESQSPEYKKPEQFQPPQQQQPQGGGYGGYNQGQGYGGSQNG